MTDGRLRDNKARRQKGRGEKKGIEMKERTGKKKMWMYFFCLWRIYSFSVICLGRYQQFI